MSPLDYLTRWSGEPRCFDGCILPSPPLLSPPSRLRQCAAESGQDPVRANAAGSQRDDPSMNRVAHLFSDQTETVSLPTSTRFHMEAVAK